ncbi:MAG: hypothetical protein RKO24_08705 [Candidatus Competibacter sp.]|nr:hypothetical protein [Candidatus Competibacter sp.]
MGLAQDGEGVGGQLPEFVLFRLEGEARRFQFPHRPAQRRLGRALRREIAVEKNLLIFTFGIFF